MDNKLTNNQIDEIIDCVIEKGKITLLDIINKNSSNNTEFLLIDLGEHNKKFTSLIDGLNSLKTL